MPKSNFIDHVRILCVSGNGGSGSTHFRREKYVSHGGPDGGDGGRGGHIILRGNRNIWTLLAFKYQKHIRAGHGSSGSKSQRSGAFGEDVILEVPLGTVVKDGETGDFEFEITSHGEEVILMKGGRGGLGNMNFKTATHQAPKYSQTGEEGEEGWKVLELKILADVGLVGFPNAGKSTLLSVLTAAKPKIANYAFTTLTPNLGIVKYRDTRSFVIADIPGIIEKAHEGKGLGHRFLKHIERNAVLLFMIPADTDSIIKEYNVLLNELAQFNEELLDKPRFLAITKSDLIDDELKEMLTAELPEGVPYQFISSVAQNGLLELKDSLYTIINKKFDFS